MFQCRFLAGRCFPGSERNSAELGDHSVLHSRWNVKSDQSINQSINQSIQSIQSVNSTNQFNQSINPIHSIHSMVPHFVPADVNDSVYNAFNLILLVTRFDPDYEILMTSP
jgi:hypothetical protein